MLPAAFSASLIFQGLEIRDLGDRPLYAVMNGRVGWRIEAADLSVDVYGKEGCSKDPPRHKRN
jgi:hypothetical protein